MARGSFLRKQICSECTYILYIFSSCSTCFATTLHERGALIYLCVHTYIFIVLCNVVRRYVQAYIFTLAYMHLSHFVSPCFSNFFIFSLLHIEWLSHKCHRDFHLSPCASIAITDVNELLAGEGVMLEF